MTDLLPCPFCGSASIDPAFWATADYCGPGCDACGATAETSAKWNERVQSGDDAQPVAWQSIGPNHQGLWWEKPDLGDQYKVQPLYAAQPPAALVDLTNHHNALKCPYCNPKGLQFAEPAAPVETERKTFTIPPGHEAVRDSEGRATGEVRPRLSAGNAGLVKELREQSIYVTKDTPPDEKIMTLIRYLESLCKRAADEIERLRERCEAYKGQVEAGAAEIKRLTEVEPQTVSEARFPHASCKTPSECRKENICMDAWNCSSPLPRPESK